MSDRLPPPLLESHSDLCSLARTSPLSLSLCLCFCLPPVCARSLSLSLSRLSAAARDATRSRRRPLRLADARLLPTRRPQPVGRRRGGSPVHRRVKARMRWTGERALNSGGTPAPNLGDGAAGQ